MILLAIELLIFVFDNNLKGKKCFDESAQFDH